MHMTKVYKLVVHRYAISGLELLNNYLMRFKSMRCLVQFGCYKHGHEGLR